MQNIKKQSIQNINTKERCKQSDTIKGTNIYKGTTIEQQNTWTLKYLSIKPKNSISIRMSQLNDKPKLHNSYLSAHPNITKRLDTAEGATSKMTVSHSQYARIQNQLYLQQRSISKLLEQKLQSLSSSNQSFSQSLIYYSPETTIKQLQSQLQSIRADDVKITEQISQCQTIQNNTTPQEYFLFKKNKRMESFNQAMDELFQEINRQKQGIRSFLNDIKIQTNQVRNNILSMQKQLNKRITKTSAQQKYPSNNYQSNKYQNEVQPEQIRQQAKQTIQSRIDFTIDQNQSQEAQKSRSNLVFASQNINETESNSMDDEDEALQIDQKTLDALKEEYKSQLQTYQIISENKEIMTTQLFNSIQTIQKSLNKHYEHEKTKLFRDINQIKEDFSYMPAQHIIPPHEAQLSYEITPLIQDYQNKLMEINRRLSTDLKNITSEILTPLRWDFINFQEFLDPLSSGQNRRSTIVSSKQSQKQHKLLQSQKQYERLQLQISRQDEEIRNLQGSLQQIMGETMVYKQKQHQLELAMNNMRKLLREQQP